MLNLADAIRYEVEYLEYLGRMVLAVRKPVTRAVFAVRLMRMSAGLV